MLDLRIMSCLFAAGAIVSAALSAAASPNPELPDTQAIERPSDPEAARMVDEYLAIMDQRMHLMGELNRLRARDSYARRVFIEIFRDQGLEPGVRKAFQDFGGEYLSQIDEINTRELKALLGEMSWRELAGYSGNLVDSAFLIVQHTSDYSYQEDVLAEIKPLAEEGLIEGSKYALMFDRVELRERDQQVYGTQADCVDGIYDVRGLIEPELVDERRTKLGMEPIADYLETIREMYGSCSSDN